MEASFGIWRTCVPFARDLLAIFPPFSNRNLLNWLNWSIIDTSGWNSFSTRKGNVFSFLFILHYVFFLWK